jgi:hypothetical protein
VLVGSGRYACLPRLLSTTKIYGVLPRTPSIRAELSSRHSSLIQGHRKQSAWTRGATLRVARARDNGRDRRAKSHQCDFVGGFGFDRARFGGIDFAEGRDDDYVREPQLPAKSTHRFHLRGGRLCGIRNGHFRVVSAPIGFTPGIRVRIGGLRCGLDRCALRRADRRTTDRTPQTGTAEMVNYA